MSGTDVIWHDVECGHFTADLAFWHELAETEPGPVLDVGAGTGRVALALARRGHDVVALDSEAALLGALRDRAGGLAVETVLGDARDFALAGRRFGLVIVAMQTLQLLGDAGRAGFLRCAHAHLAPGGLVACALATDLAPWSSPPAILPLAHAQVIDGVEYHSQAVGRRDGTRVVLRRIRTVIAADGAEHSVDYELAIDRIDAAQVAAEGQAAGFTPLPARTFAPGTANARPVVVLLRG